MKTYPHEPAHPIILPEGGAESDGLTKRESFAKSALQGLLANPNDSNAASHVDFYAETAVKIADGLVKALNHEDRVKHMARRAID